ncbi:hypothetical protein TKK_0005279 [Trichogramma kaykai]|uniref:C2H2-type domain-containing protein n=1 Tax=Trichogramma kaykai TaxID=54128 RepID=A0ABD2XJ35_9HYME
MENHKEFVDLITKLGVGTRPVNDPFFNETHDKCKVFARKGVVAEDNEEFLHKVVKTFPCNMCSKEFKNLLDFELHYSELHHYKCSTCNKSRPSSHLLDLHIQENHDSFFQVQAEKKPMYRCYLSECKDVFFTPALRKDHCRNDHQFPATYRFEEFDHKEKKPDANKVAKKKDKPDSKHQSKKSESHSHKPGPIVTNKSRTFSNRNFSVQPIGQPNDSSPIKNDEPKKPFTEFIPRSVQQNMYAKKLTNNKEGTKDVLESESLMDLAETLPSIQGIYNK